MVALYLICGIPAAAVGLAVYMIYHSIIDYGANRIRGLVALSWIAVAGCVGICGGFTGYAFVSVIGRLV